MGTGQESSEEAGAAQKGVGLEMKPVRRKWVVDSETAQAVAPSADGR
jgi:hypothetical protein